jgi:hypothetical protein
VTRLDGDAVRTAVAAFRELLERVPDGEASVPVMEGTVLFVVEHVAGSVAHYAHDLAAGPSEVWATELLRLPDADLPKMSASVGAWAEVLARTLDAAAPSERGWHPFGRPDPTGYAAMACVEVLVHGADIAGALGLTWAPSTDLAVAALDRLFPDVERTGDAMADLVWATGRADPAGDRPRREAWRYATAPVEERA